MTDPVDTSAEAVALLLLELDLADQPLASNAAATLRALLAERDRAVEARTVAVREMAAMARQYGVWQGIAEGKDAVIRQVEAERDALRQAVTLGADALDALLDGGAILSSESAAITRDFVRRMRAALNPSTGDDA